MSSKSRSRTPHAANSRVVSSRHPSRNPGEGNRNRDARDDINRHWDLRNDIDARRQEREKEEQHRHRDDRDRFGIHDDYRRGNNDRRHHPILDYDDPFAINGIRAFTHKLQQVEWPAGFKLTGITKYDGSVEPFQWLQVYDMAIRAAERIDSDRLASHHN